MKKSKDKFLLKLILKYCDDVEYACELFGEEYEIFESCIPFQNACIMPIFQIGELCKRISDELKENNPQLDWKGWCGTRDFFAHQYINLDAEITWEIIKQDLPQMKKLCQKLLK